MKLFPGDQSYETAKQILSRLAASLLYAILPLAALALGMHRRAGVVAGWLGIAVFFTFPKNIQPLETQGTWELTYAALALAVLLILTACGVTSTAGAIGYGVAWGVALQIIPSAALIFPVWLAIAAGRRLRFAALSTLCLLLALAPWTLRNWLVLGSPVWGRDNLGLELYVSNNDCAWPHS